MAAAGGDTIRAGEIINITVSGFAANTDLSFMLGSKTITVSGDNNTDADGAAAAGYTLSNYISGGAQTLTVYGRRAKCFIYIHSRGSHKRA